MDIFTKKHFTFWTILTLVILNLGTLTALWFIQLRKPILTSPPPGIRPEDAQYFLIRELNFDKDQTDQYHALKDKHARRSQQIRREIHQLRGAIRDELQSSSPDTSLMNRLSAQIGMLHAEQERILFDHFIAVKSLCNPEQSVKLEQIIDELFRIIAPPEPHRPPMQKPPGGQQPGRRPPGR